MEERDPLNPSVDPPGEPSETAIARTDSVEEAFEDEAPADWKDLVKPLILNPYFIGFVAVLVFVLTRFW